MYLPLPPLKVYEPRIITYMYYHKFRLFKNQIYLYFVTIIFLLQIT